MVEMPLLSETYNTNTWQIVSQSLQQTWIYVVVLGGNYVMNYNLKQMLN